MKINSFLKLTKFELRKLFTIVFFLCLAISLIKTFKVNVFMPKKLYSSRSVSFINEDDEIIELSGEEAKLKMKELSLKHQGLLTIEKFESAFVDFKAKLEEYDSMGQIIWNNEYDDIDRIFTECFRPLGRYDYYIKNEMKLSDIKGIYKNRISQLETSMNYPENKIHKSTMITKQAEKIKTPFYYDGNYSTYKKLLGDFRKVKYFFIIIILCASFVFYNETIFSSSIQFSLSCKNGRMAHALAKINALILMTTIIYIFTLGLYAVLSIYTNGTDGAKTQMQVLHFYSLFNGTVSEGVILKFIIVYFAGVFFAILTFFISVNVKNMASTIILSIACMYIGTVIPEGTIFERLIFLFPSSAISSNTLFLRPIVYNFFGKPIPLCYMYIPACIVISIILSVLIVRKFEKMEY